MKKIIVITILSLILLIFTSIVYADSFSFVVTPDKTNLKPGDEIEFTLKVANINVGSNGINAVEATLEYDINVFEVVKGNDVHGKNNWAITYNSEETTKNGKMLGLIISGGVTDDQEIGTIKLKVKDTVSGTTAKKQSEIKFTNIATNNGVDMVKDTDKTITVNVDVNQIVAQEVKPVTVAEQVREIEQARVSTNSEDNVEKNGDITTAVGNVPQTGTNEIILVFFATIVSIVGIASYTRYKRIKIK